MFNLYRIKRPKSEGGDYLGISAGFLIEVTDSDPCLHNLLPKGADFTVSSTLAYRGHKRLNLLDYSGTCLIVIRSGQTKAGIQHAKLEIYNNRGDACDLDIIATIVLLASYRWPSGVLQVTKKALKNMAKILPSAFIRAGWKDVRDESGKIAYQIRLPKPKVR